MSRTFVALSLLAALTTGAAARTFHQPSFAQPPPSTSVSNADEPVVHFEPSSGYAHMPPSTSVSNGAQMDIYEEHVVVDRAAVRAKLAANRATNLQRFRAYQKKGVFPSNTFQDGKLNVWIDIYGNLCAAATIISASGMHDLVLDVGDTNNFIKLADVQQGALMDWILTSGLTQDEIAAIQEPFVRVDQPMPSVEPAPILVDAKLRKAEDARLMRRYRQVDASIVRNAKRSLDAATDRLMAQPHLARAFLAS